MPRLSSHLVRYSQCCTVVAIIMTPIRVRILLPRLRRNVGRSSPLMRFQTARRSSVWKATGKLRQWILVRSADGFSVSGASDQMGSRYRELRWA